MTDQEQKAPPTEADPDLRNVLEHGREPGAGVYGKLLREKVSPPRNMTDQELHELARNVLTPKQLEVWRLTEARMSQRAIAYHLGIDRATVRHHLTAANNRLTAAGAKG